MGHRRRYSEDPLFEYTENFRRAEATLRLAIGMLVGWVVCTLIAAASGGSPPSAIPAVAGIFATFLGWGGLLIGMWAGLQYAYAYLYPYLMSRIDR